MAHAAIERTPVRRCGNMQHVVDARVKSRFKKTTELAELTNDIGSWQPTRGSAQWQFNEARRLAWSVPPATWRNAPDRHDAHQARHCNGSANPCLASCAGPFRLRLVVQRRCGHRANSGLSALCLAAIVVIFGHYLWHYSKFAKNDPDRLQSEQYRVQMQHLQLVAAKDLPEPLPAEVLDDPTANPSHFGIPGQRWR